MIPYSPTGRAHIVNHATAVVVHVSLEVHDERGRLMGANISRFEADFIEPLAGATWHSCYAYRGHAFGFCPHATRNGKNYGAAQSDQWFETAEERDAAIVKYIASAQKRANKRAKV